MLVFGDKVEAQGAPDDRTSTWKAALIAMLPALAAIVTIEAIRVSTSVGGSESSFWRALSAFAEVTGSGVRQLGPLILVSIVQAIVLRFAIRGPKRPLWWPVLAGLSGVLIYLVWLVAIEAPYLAREFWVKAGFNIVAVVHGLLLLWLAAPSFIPRVRRVIGGLICGVSLFVAVAHYSVLVGLYPTLHSSGAMMAFLGAHLGFTMLLGGARRSLRRSAVMVGASSLLLVVGLLAPSSARAVDRPYVAAHSALVRPVAIAETSPELLRPSAPPRRRDEGSVRPDAEAIERFSKQSGLPTLPPGFDLSEFNVLVVFIDAMRYDRTSLADPALGTTPTLAGLVRDGARSHSRAFAPSNGTYPSMASFFSMTTPSFVRHEIHGRHWHGRVYEEQQTVTEAFQEAGYRTFFVGTNFKRVMTYRVHGIWQGFDHRHLELVWPGRDLDADARLAAKAIREIRAARAAKQRYFGVVFFISPHDDYQVHFPRRPSETPRDRYDQELLYADHQLRRLLAEVSAANSGAREKTIVIVTGDHGEAFGEHRHRFHLSSLYSEQVHVPLVVSVPGADFGGGEQEQPVSTTNVLPWLMLRGPEATRRAAEAALREDVGPLMRETDGAVISEFISRQRQHATLRYDDYTLYYDVMADYFRIFDARRDPAEQVDLREQRPDLVERFIPAIQAYRQARFAGQRYHFAPPEQWAPDPP